MLPLKVAIRMPFVPQKIPRSAGFIQVVGAVLSAFVGIRRRQAADRDHIAVKPAHLIVAGVLCALLFIASLVIVVRLVVAR